MDQILYPANRAKVYHCLNCGDNFPIGNNICPWCRSDRKMACEEKIAKLLTIKNKMKTPVKEITINHVKEILKRNEN